MSLAEDSQANTGVPMNIAQLRLEFKRLRRKLGYSQEYVATTLLGVTQATLSAWETGKNQSMRTETLNQVFDLVGVWRGRREDITNIVALEPIKPLPNRSEFEREEEKPSNARTELERAVKSSLDPARPSFNLVENLLFEDLLDLYVFTRLR